jgi:hypothetical protein
VKVTIDIRDEVPAHHALSRITAWYRSHNDDPAKYPMKGIITYPDGITLFKRDNRKGDCFVAFRKQEPLKEVLRPTKEVNLE